MSFTPTPLKGPFQAGDIVEVTKPGATYTTFRDIFRALGFQNPEDAHDPFKTGTLAKVIGCYQHPDQDRILVACITEDGQEGIIGAHGLKLSDKFQVTKAFTMPEGWLCPSHPVFANKHTLKVGCQEINTHNLAVLVGQMIGMNCFTPEELGWMQRCIETYNFSK